MASPLITDDLTKVYDLGRRKGARTAVDCLSIEVPEGVVFGFLGPNGAGKTTTIKMLLDFVRPTSGSASILDRPTTDSSARALVGYLPEQPYFHRFLKPIEVLTMHGALAGMEKRSIRPRALHCLERAGIAEYADTPISKLSKGLTQRVGIAQAIISDPKLLILDEPTSGLDPIGRRHVRDLIIELRNEGKTVFLSSHLLSEVENTCDIVAVLKRGKLVAHGAPDEVRSGRSLFVVQTTAIDRETTESLRFLDVSIEQRPQSAVLTIDPDAFYPVTSLLHDRGIEVVRVDTARESLEEAFLRLAA